MNRFSRLLFLFLNLVFICPVFADGLSREQGDAIIGELKQIRALLEKQQKGAAPAAALPERVRLKLGKEYSFGRDDAPLVLMEYMDYQCPYCSRFLTATLPELRKQYVETGKLRVISRDLPIETHPHALKAAQAARCAGEQDQYWRMQDTLMANLARLNQETIISLADGIVPDMTRYKSCMESESFLKDIRAGVEAAHAVGFNGTPSFVIGRVKGEFLEGYTIVGAQPYAAFETLIKQLLSGEKK